MAIVPAFIKIVDERRFSSFAGNATNHHSESGTRWPHPTDQEEAGGGILISVSVVVVVVVVAVAVADIEDVESVVRAMPPDAKAGVGVFITCFPSSFIDSSTAAIVSANSSIVDEF